MVLFIDGQKIAKKLRSSISQVAQRLLEECNEATRKHSCAVHPASLQDVLSLKSRFLGSRLLISEIQVFLGGKLGKNLCKLL